RPTATASRPCPRPPRCTPERRHQGVADWQASNIRESSVGASSGAALTVAPPYRCWLAGATVPVPSAALLPTAGVVMIFRGCRYDGDRRGCRRLNAAAATGDGVRIRRARCGHPRYLRCSIVVGYRGRMTGLGAVDKAAEVRRGSARTTVLLSFGLVA